LEEQASISQISKNMGIYDSFFALPFGKIGIYGLISPRFCGMGSGHSALGSPFNRGDARSIVDFWLKQ
jgi:hypothetical protein